MSLGVLLVVALAAALAGLQAGAGEGLQVARWGFLRLVARLRGRAGLAWPHRPDPAGGG
jgi:hypothetical protein